MSGASRRRRRWNDLNNAQKTAVVAIALVELALTATSLVDLARRPAGAVRGRKPVWVAACFVQPVGPVAYLAFGRRNG